MITLDTVCVQNMEDYKETRLDSLLDSPGSFSTTYADALLRTKDSWVQQVKGFEEQSKSIALIAKDENERIGMAAEYVINENEGEICQVWVKNNKRGQGIAELMLDEIVKWNKKMNITRMKAVVYRKNERAIAFYKKYGFEIYENNEDKDNYELWYEVKEKMNSF